MTCTFIAYASAAAGAALGFFVGRLFRVGGPDMTATDHAKVLTTLSENLRQINSLRDFVAACEVGAKIAGEMLTAMESHLLDCMDQIGDGP